MTMPDERTRALLWAGALLVHLNGDPRVPMELRRITTSISLHFSTVEDVEHAATLPLLKDSGGMFEHPPNGPNWQKKCTGPPLTHRTRLNWPSVDVCDGAEDGGRSAISYKIKITGGAPEAASVHVKELAPK